MDPDDMIVEEYIEEPEEAASTVCEDCGKGFVNIYTLKQHKRIVHQNLKEFYCDRCNQAFATNYKLQRHVQGVHNEVRDVHCEVCGASFKTKEYLNKHSRTHFKGPFECQICCLVFKYKSGLDYHFKLKHEEKPKAKRKIKQKVKETLKIETLPLDEIIELDLPEEIKTEPEALINNSPAKTDVICDSCGSFFKTKTELKRHNARKHGNKSEFKFSCVICEKKFLIKYELQRHFSKHQSDRIYGCSQCETKFKTQASLKGHVKTVHASDQVKEKKFECAVCSSLFFYERHLNYHMRKHTNERMYNCEVDDCVACFLTSDSLKWHKIRDHNEPAPFSCAICDRKFIHKKVAENHENEHGDDGSLTVFCPICGKKVSEKRHLKRHMRIHEKNAYECEFCTDTFKERYMLTKHLSACLYRTEEVYMMRKFIMNKK